MRGVSMIALALACAGCRVEEQHAAATAGGPPGAVAVPATDEAGGRRLYYVPVYSHIYYRDTTGAFDLAATLSVRNTDPEHPLTLRRVDYYATDGRPLRAHLAAPRTLRPLETAEFVVPRNDASGGSGANFLVELDAAGTTEPVVEAVMAGISGTAGVSFVSPAHRLTRP